MGWITFSYIGGRKNESWMAAASKSQTHREEEEENSISEMKMPLFRDSPSLKPWNCLTISSKLIAPISDD